MSQVKKSKIVLIIILAVISIFAFGCKKDVSVDDISFSLKDDEQVVLLVGQTFNISNYISISPSYATNQKYKLTSGDENVVMIKNNKLVAVAEGSTQVRVVADDNDLKEDVLTIVVKETQTTLSAPENLSFNGDTKVFSFDAVDLATSYTFRVNGEEFDIGNSCMFELNRYRGKTEDELLVVQVKANAPTYSYALKSSKYTDEFKVYQAGKIEDVQIKDGVLSFKKPNFNLGVNVYADNEILFENIADSVVSLKNLEEIYAGKNLSIKLEAVVPNIVKETHGEEVAYYNSLTEEINVSVLNVPQIVFNSNELSWNNIAHASSYDILINGTKFVENVKDNHFNLESFVDFKTMFVEGTNYCIAVVPCINGVENVAMSIKTSEINLKKLADASVVSDGKKISWNEVDNASHYIVSLVKDGNETKVSTTKTEFSLNGYDPGEYSIYIRPVGTILNGENYISSKSEEFKCKKLESISAEIVDYKIKLNNLGEYDCSIVFDDSRFNRDIEGDGTVKEIPIFDEGFKYDFAPNGHKVTIIRKSANSAEIESDPCEKTFVQLEKISSISMEDHVASVSRSEINKNAIIKFNTIGNSVDYTQVGDAVAFNTTHLDGEYPLPAGDYTVSLYVDGDGSSTFAYMENCEIVSTAAISFSVLEIPTIELRDSSLTKISFEHIENSNEYGFMVNGEEKEPLSENFYNFELKEGNIVFNIQTRGDGKDNLNSAYSEDVVVSRLLSPDMTFNNKTNIVSKKENNDPTLVKGYIFKINDVEEPYDFVSPLSFTSDAVLSLECVAETSNGNNLYLNSNPTILKLSKISLLDVDVKLDEDNNILISCPAHSKEYSLYVKIDNGEKVYEFISGSRKIKDEINSVELEYVYDETSKTYKIVIINDFNTVIEDLGYSFDLDVQFIEPSIEYDKVINSAYLSASLELARIDGETEIIVNYENKLVIKPQNQTKEYGIVMTLNNDEDLTFVGNGSSLVCESVNLPYQYDESSKSYIVTLLDDNYNKLSLDMETDFSVNIKYTHYINASNLRDLDSEYIGEKSIKVQAKPTISRDGQMLKIDKGAKVTYDYQNYLILVNGRELELASDFENVNNKIVFDSNYIYQNAPKAVIKDINEICVVTLNVDSSESNPILSTKGESIFIQKAEDVVLNSFKFNNNEDGKENNSAAIQFKIHNTSFVKQNYIYYVEIFESSDEKIELRFIDGDADVDGNISFYIDDIKDLNNLNIIYINAYVATTDSYTATNTIEVFNSNVSGPIVLKKIKKPSNIKVENSVLKFDAVEDAVGYEIYQKVGSVYDKINNGLVMTNEYDLKDISGEKEIVIKSISKVENCTNSDYSNPLKVGKLSAPVVSTSGGKIVVDISTKVAQLLANEKISVSIGILNGEQSFDVDLKNLIKDKTILNGTLLVCEPDLFMKYNSANSILMENLKIRTQINQTEAVDGLFYLNSDEVEMKSYGLFAPTKVSRTSSSEETVESISWIPSDKNYVVLDDSSTLAISSSYVFKIEHTVGDQTTPYYSSEKGLKYYDENLELQSYPALINGTSALFPAGYDKDDDGILDVVFEAGRYKVYVKAVPTSVVENFNFTSSKFSNPTEFEILEKVNLTIHNGEISWTARENATAYQVSVFEGDKSTPVLIEKVTSTDYAFKDSLFNSKSGVYRVIVKAIGSNKVNILNSKDSDEFYVYRLPEVKDVYVEDGRVVFTATTFFSRAIVEFYDESSHLTEYIPIDNSMLADEKLANLADSESLSTWKGFVNNNLVDGDVAEYVLAFDQESLEVKAGRNFKINIVLIGNSNLDLGLISSSKATEISNMNALKINANVNDVADGMLQYTLHSNFIGRNFNYKFNNTTASDFWSATAVFKINISYVVYKQDEETKELIKVLGELNSYVVDYYSFIEAVESGDITADEYKLYNSVENDLYAVVKYPYGDGSENLYFSVYKENKIDFNKSYFAYYRINETVAHGTNTLSMEFNPENADGIFYLNLINGGVFTVKIFTLGGDGYAIDESGNVLTKEDEGFADFEKYGYISSSTNYLKTFVKYVNSTLISKDGMLVFDNLLEFEGDERINNPIYRIKAKISDEDISIFYLYYFDEEDAKHAAESYYPLDFSSDETKYIKIDESQHKLDDIIFDISSLLSGGNYLISIQTLAGRIDGEQTTDYHLNAQNVLSSTFKKLSETKFVVADGVLEFEQAYIVETGEKIYNETYEITIEQGGKNYIYTIDGSSEGVSIDNASHKIKYVLPKTIVADKNSLDISEGEEYQIKIRAISDSSLTLNAAYGEISSFSKVQGLSTIESEKLRIENGVLKWKVLDVENSKGIGVKVTFLDENDETTIIPIIILGLEDNGEGSYEFGTDYQLQENIWVQLLHKIKDRIVDYKISAYVLAGNGYINSNYSAEFTTQRLNRVKAETIKTYDGILTWEAVENADAYEIVIGANKFVSKTNEIDVATQVDLSTSSTHKIQIRAIGSNLINGWRSTDAEGFKQLGQTSVDSIQFSENDLNTIVWDEVAGAQSYVVTFCYEDRLGKTNVINKRVENNSFEFIADIKESFTISIIASGLGDGKELQGKAISKEFILTTPNQVNKIEFNSEKNRFEFEVGEDFSSGDFLEVSYKLSPYTNQDGVLGTDESEPIKINYKEGSSIYYWPLTIMGVYEDIKVKIVRNNLSSVEVEYENDDKENLVNLNKFAYGDGTSENPYAIGNLTHLLNIEYYTSSHYQIISAINLQGVNVNERIIKHNGAIICSEFSGHIDGAVLQGESNYSIYGFNTNSQDKTDTIYLSNINKFALFGKINKNATIKNLTFGRENYQMIIENLIANDEQNVINLSLIANEADNATLENIKILNLNYKIKSNNGTALSSGVINIAGMVNKLSNSTITKSDVQVKVSFEAGLSGGVSVNIGGVGTEGIKSNVNNSNILIKISVSNANSILTSVGGVFANFEGNTSLSNGIEQTIVQFEDSSFRGQFVGGLVGFAKNIKVVNSKTLGLISMKGIVHEIKLGGLVGWGQDVNIQDSGSFMDLDISLGSTTQDRHIGMIIGLFENISAGDSARITNCYSHISNVGQTSISGNNINIGMYGKAPAGYISGLYQKDKETTWIITIKF